MSRIVIVALATSCVAVVMAGASLLAEPPQPDAPIPRDDRVADELASARAEIAGLRRRLDAMEAAASRKATENAASQTRTGSVAGLLPAGTDPNRVAQAENLAERIRREAEARAANAARDAARQVQAEVQAEEAFLRDQARGGVMQTLRNLAAAKTHAFALVDDPQRLATFFQRHASGPTIRPSGAWDPSEPLESGTTVILEAGVHRWSVSRLHRSGDFPEDVLVRGAGMDQTLLRLDEISAQGEVKSLTFEDLTLDASDNYLTDLRSENPVTIKMVRCRVVGFDMGAGGSVMLAARTAAFHAVDSRFEAGFGRTAPGFGNLFRVSRGLLVRMDRCVFNGPFRSVYDDGSAATYVFSECRFENMPARTKSGLESPPSGVRMDNCTFAYLDANARPDRRPIRSINNDW